jgi:hypothetical protein
MLLVAGWRSVVEAKVAVELVKLNVNYRNVQKSSKNQKNTAASNSKTIEQ